jgi:hypothetical protein
MIECPSPKKGRVTEVLEPVFLDIVDESLVPSRKCPLEVNPSLQLPLV